MNLPERITVKQACEITGKSKSTIDRWKAKNKRHGVSGGKIVISELIKSYSIMDGVIFPSSESVENGSFLTRKENEAFLTSLESRNKYGDDANKSFKSISITAIVALLIIWILTVVVLIGTTAYVFNEFRSFSEANLANRIETVTVDFNIEKSNLKAEIKKKDEEVSNLLMIVEELERELETPPYLRRRSIDIQ